MGLARKIQRQNAQRATKAFTHTLVKQGKRMVINKENQIEIVDVPKPYRKAEQTNG